MAVRMSVSSAPFVFDCHCWISAALGGRDTQLIRDVTLLQFLSLSLSLPRIWTPNRPSKSRDSPMELIFSRCRYFGNQVHKLQGEGPHDHSDVGYCAHYLACWFDALSVLRSTKYFVWFWTPPSWPIRSLPRATLQPEGTSLQRIPNSAKPHHLSSDAIFSGQLRDISAQKFLEN